MSRKYWNADMDYSQPDEQLLRRNARETALKEKKKGKKLEPVIIDGKKIASSWWGQAWCDNLERYADYESRLDRGKRYVRTGAVVDLKIEKGNVQARVQGRRKVPYKVEIRISPLSEERTQDAISKCGRRIESLEQLVNGDFPVDLQDLFTASDGLFPKPQEISFQCSCPDWALLCKHVAAVLYGIGNRLDHDPLLFFKLRGIDVDRFVDITIENRIESMLQNADVVTDRVIESENWEDLFGL